jgi:hypothetical protein
MTIINRTYGFVFIHVPKTGGTSVKEHLRQYSKETDVHIDRPADAEQLVSVNGVKLAKHSSATQIRKLLGRTEFEGFFKFCVVRNPFVRTMSLFRFLKFNFRSWPRAHLMQEINTLEEFVCSPIFSGSGPGGIVSPQLHWLTDRSGASCVDFIARVERIDDDFSKIKAQLALPLSGKPLLRRNASKGDAEKLAIELNSGRVVDVIRARYASDFRFLGYSTEPGEAVELKEVAFVDGVCTS